MGPESFNFWLNSCRRCLAFVISPSTSSPKRVFLIRILGKELNSFFSSPIFSSSSISSSCTFLLLLSSDTFKVASLSFPRLSFAFCLSKQFRTNGDDDDNFSPPCDMGCVVCEHGAGGDAHDDRDTFPCGSGGWRDVCDGFDTCTCGRGGGGGGVGGAWGGLGGVSDDRNT